MTQRTGDFIRGLMLPISELAVGLYLGFKFNLFSALILLISLAIVNVAVNALVIFKTVTVKSVKLLEDEAKGPDKIKGTIEDRLISEVCQYASEKHLNPSIDLESNGLFLNANKDNTIIGICELTVPEPKTKYLSDDYKHCYDINIEAIDKFVSQHPEFKGE